jgi:hypothetical protein
VALERRIYPEPAAGLGGVRYVTALVREDFFQKLRPSGFARGLIERVAVLAPIVRSRRDDDPPSVPEIDLANRSAADAYHLRAPSRRPWSLA